MRRPRDTVFDALLQQIEAALEVDPTFGGLAFGLTYGRPEESIEAVAGAPAIKDATLTMTVHYERGGLGRLANLAVLRPAQRRTRLPRQAAVSRGAGMAPMQNRKRLLLRRQST